MVRTHALMESVSANLQEFLQPIGVDLTKPQKKFLREGLLGLLRAARPVVCRMARKLPSRRRKFLSRLDRLEMNLNRQSDLDKKLKAAMPAVTLSNRTKVSDFYARRRRIKDNPLIASINNVAGSGI